ncbi:RNA polymerase factor sigma-54 [Virgibacillus ndiopensis]|uniref:RNA polymerase factor sigma-54 n=1 Tax=Virgibacillus ndiopensis TaxID=2004408 RepID=UPI000C081959|nr:RNA polymerase factor sigma-54 [Virgibacillus ndiopensis]
MELGLFQKQTANLVMTTELRQAIALLQYSTLELSQFIHEQIVDNPLIELEENPWESHLADREQPDYNRTQYTHNGEDTYNPLDFIATDDRGLHEDLLEQVRWLNISKQEQSILEYLILNLDDNGYLSITNEEIGTQLAIPEQVVENSIKFLQNLEPIGVGARNLKECLLLQVKAYYPKEQLVACVIKDYFELLANKKWKKISENLNISLMEIKRITDCIQTLDPKPCSKLSIIETSYLYPDITIEKTNGDYVISMNDRYLPKVQLNQQYKDLINNKSHVSVSNYINKSYQKYMWLVKSIEQRKSTILRITNVIVEKQRNFLDNGFTFLQPMTLKEIADEIGMHESTVSRATNNKVIQTPNGSFEMRRLFTSKLRTNNENNASSIKVKLLLKRLINEEDKRTPLSDQKIADYFKKQNGITISRRTVAKYREELNILSSSKRKTII